ncbi:hypothetical protein BH11PLA1_BH11PLA1_08570 [soil metagenome]
MKSGASAARPMSGDGATSADAAKTDAPAAGHPWYDPLGVFTKTPPPPEAKPTPVTYEAAARLGYTPTWTGFATVQKGARLMDMEFVGGLILAHDTRSAFTALSPVSGDVRWTHLEGEPLSSFKGSAAAGKNLYLCDDSRLFIVDADTGQPVTDARSGSPIKQTFALIASTPPISAGSMLVMGSGSGRAFAHVPGYGASAGAGGGGVTAWQYLIGKSIMAEPLVLENGLVAFVSVDGKVVLLNLSTGTAAGKATVFGGIVATPAAGDGRIYVVSQDQSIYAFDDQNCGGLWRVRTESQLIMSPTFDEGKVYVQVPAAGLVALDAGTGRQAWASPDVKGRVIARRKNTLITWDGTTAVSVEASSGAVVERVEMPGVMDVRAETFRDGNLYVVWPTGQISKLAPK